jgi:hypothetical protein
MPTAPVMPGYTDTPWMHTSSYDTRLKTTLSLRIELARKIMEDSMRRLTELGLYTACDCAYSSSPTCYCGAQQHFRKMWIDRYIGQQVDSSPTGQQDAGQQDAGQQDAGQQNPGQQVNSQAEITKM